MKILLVNTSECTGGAAVACGRLLDALNRHGVKAKMLVRDKQTDNLRVVSVEHKWLMKWYFLWERLLIWIANCFSRKHLFAVDIANAGIDITTLPEFQEADLIPLYRFCRRYKVCSPLLARYMVSTDGVAEPNKTNACSFNPRHSATSLAE